MASTKQMQAKAKAAKKIAQQTVNFAGFTELLSAAAEIVIAFNPTQSYNSSSVLDENATIIYENKLAKVSKNNFLQILAYREDLEKYTSKNYGVEFVTGYMTFGWDADGALKEKNVPQKMQVIHGLIDLLIGKLVVLGGHQV
jgi:hypothetical protein